MRYLCLILLALVLPLASCGGSGSNSDDIGIAGAAATANPYSGHSSTTYAGSTNWLCHPGLVGAANVCNADLDTTAVEANGAATVESFQPAADPRVDCFYIYPTTSLDPGPNSDLIDDIQEQQTTALQAARYGEVCRLFAPVYRQRTLTTLALTTVTNMITPLGLDDGASEIAYADVLDAFREYIANQNQGRGFILIGHSQGASLLRRLVAEEVEAEPFLSSRLVAAHLIGSLIEVPIRADVGGIFASTPACRSPGQTGCVIAYSSFRKGDPELSNPRFGVTGNPATRALCTNPAALAGGPAELDLRLPFQQPPAFQALIAGRFRGTAGPYADPIRNLTTLLDTPFFAVPGQVSGECVVNDAGASYLEISIAADPADPRADDYPGEFLGGTGWGLHIADVNLAQGDLVRVAAMQAAAWLEKN